MAREQKFAIEPGGDKRVVVKWQGIWKNVEVLFDGQRLGEPFPNLKALKEGRQFRLPDGRALDVRFVQSAFNTQGLTLLLDGRPLPGAGNDPRVQIKLAAGLLYFVAGLSALLGIVGLAGVRFMRDLGFSWPSLVAGVVLAVLAYVGVKYRSRVAFGIAAGIIALDMVLTFALTAGVGHVPFAAIFFRILILAAVIRGIKAVGDLRELEKKELAETFR